MGEEKIDHEPEEKEDPGNGHDTVSRPADGQEAQAAENQLSAQGGPDAAEEDIDDEDEDEDDWDDEEEDDDEDSYEDGSPNAVDDAGH